MKGTLSIPGHKNVTQSIDVNDVSLQSSPWDCRAACHAVPFATRRDGMRVAGRACVAAREWAAARDHAQALLL